jgi:hypothetical protein
MHSTKKEKDKSGVVDAMRYSLINKPNSANLPKDPQEAQEENDILAFAKQQAEEQKQLEKLPDFGSW